jgi:hypothetical protein
MAADIEGSQPIPAPVRSDALLREIPVLIFSTDTAKEAEEFFTKSGISFNENVAGYLRKAQGISREALAGMVGEILARYGRTRNEFPDWPPIQSHDQPRREPMCYAAGFCENAKVRADVNGGRAERKKGVLVPVENAPEAAVVAGLPVIPVRNLREAVGFLGRSADCTHLRGRDAPV